MQFLNGKNTNNKVNRWSLELATYNISFEWISGARNKAADCLSGLVTPTSTSVNMLTASLTDGPAFHTRSHTQNAPLVPPQLHIKIQHLRFLRNPLLPQNHSQQNAWKPYYKCRRLTHSASIFPGLLNGKAPHHEFDTFTHVKGLLYKHIMDAGKKFLALVIPKSWKYTVLMEAHDKLGHQGNS